MYRAENTRLKRGVALKLLPKERVLTHLERQERRMADVVKLRYFAGLTGSGTARALELSPGTVNRLWTAARAWLHQKMRS